ncbi:MAG: h16 [Acidimicrobiales bacterium]|nr:h16 [Acidimicrobiales bacterium]
MVTDYEGLGTPGVHTYIVGLTEGKAMLDAVLAAQQLPGGDVRTNAPVGLVGYSQGGSAAGLAAQLGSS